MRSAALGLAACLVGCSAQVVVRDDAPERPESACVMLGEPTAVADGLRFGRLATTDQHVYYLGEDGIRRWPACGGEVEILLERPVNSGSLDGGFAYWFEQGELDDSIWRMALDTAQAELLFTWPSLASMAARDGVVYWLEQYPWEESVAHHAIMTSTGGEPVVLSELMGFPAVQGGLVATEYGVIYSESYDAGFPLPLMIVPLQGGDPEALTGTNGHTAYDIADGQMFFGRVLHDESSGLMQKTMIDGEPVPWPTDEPTAKEIRTLFADEHEICWQSVTVPVCLDRSRNTTRVIGRDYVGYPYGLTGNADALYWLATNADDVYQLIAVRR